MSKTKRMSKTKPVMSTTARPGWMRNLDDLVPLTVNFVLLAIMTGRNPRPPRRLLLALLRHIERRVHACIVALDPKADPIAYPSLDARVQRAVARDKAMDAAVARQSDRRRARAQRGLRVWENALPEKARR